jgi:bifunctional non-homologous end joining protein LigD
MMPVTRKLPDGDAWSYEFKWDGLRICAAAMSGQLRLQSRLGNDLGAKFPELETLTASVGSIVLDGELVVMSGQLPDFDAVLGRRQAQGADVPVLAERRPASVMVFDLLALKGVDWRRRPYTERRAALERLQLPPGWKVPPVADDRDAALAVSLEYGLEGVVAKRRASRYTSGSSAAWIKYRHQLPVDALVIGWLRRASGGVSLLLAEATTADGLVYAGRCTAPRSIAEVLGPFQTKSPAAPVPGAPRQTQWVHPVLEVEVIVSSRKPNGQLRQPRLARIRLDKLEDDR